MIAIVHGAQVGDPRSPDLAGQLGAEHRLGDAPRVDELVGRVELLEPLQEEGPLLGVEQREPLVQRHLADVGFHLREVGVRRRRDAQVLRHAPAQVPRDFGRAAIVVARGGGSAVHLGGEFRGDIEHQTAPQLGEPDGAARLDQEARVGAHGGGPGVLVARVLDDAHDLQAPILRVGALVAEALEGDAHLDLVAPGGEVAARLVDVIGVQVDRRVEPAAGAGAAGRAGAHAVAPHAVLLHAEGIDREQQGAPVIEIGIEQDLDPVVGVDVVAVGEGGAHHVAVRLERADAEPDGIGGIPHQHFGRVLGGAAVHGAVL